MGIAVSLPLTSAFISNGVVLEHMPLVRAIVRRFLRRKPPHIDAEDLVSWGVLGLLEAKSKYNPRKFRTPFRVYAAQRIRGSILDELRKMDFVPRSVRAKGKCIQAAVSELERKLRRAPTGGEIADELSLSAHKYERWRFQAECAGDIYSMDLMPEGTCLREEDGQRSDPFESCLRSERSRALAVALSSLPERERAIMELYYWRGLTMDEIRRFFGLTESRISQIHAWVINRLRERLPEEFSICS